MCGLVKWRAVFYLEIEPHRAKQEWEKQRAETKDKRNGSLGEMDGPPRPTQGQVPESRLEKWRSSRGLKAARGLQMSAWVSAPNVRFLRQHRSWCNCGSYMQVCVLSFWEVFTSGKTNYLENQAANAPLPAKQGWVRSSVNAWESCFHNWGPISQCLRSDKSNLIKLGSPSLKH